jgi:integrase
MAREKLTAGRITKFACARGKAQSFLWDSEVPGLAIRATANGSKAFVFQGKLGGKSMRITIGDVDVWDIEGIEKDGSGQVIKHGAREEARRLQALIDQKIDPRHAKADQVAAAEARRLEQDAQRQEAQRRLVCVRDAWDSYLKARKAKWGARHYADHENLASPGGCSDDNKELKPGALASLMALSLGDLTQARVQRWLEAETAVRPTQAALAFRLLRAFLNWCEEESDYAGIADPGACSAKKTREVLPKRAAKTDCLQREQLPAWFSAVRKIKNKTIAAYLQALLLTGARREELANMKWIDVDFQWKSLTIRDKVEGERTIPLTPYVASLLLELKNLNEAPPKVRDIRQKRAAKTKQPPPAKRKASPWVFSSEAAKSGRLQEPSIQHRKACAAAGFPGLTLHGLRRSFKSLSEWVEIPAGIVAQIMGHKPSATAEKHYTVRPLDLLRSWHTKIEAWILDEGKVAFIPGSAEASKHESRKSGK